MTNPSHHPDELLHELLDGRLGDAERAAVEQHLAGCQRCQRLHASLASARALLRTTADEGAPASLRGELAAALADAVRPPAADEREAPSPATADDEPLREPAATQAWGPARPLVPGRSVRRRGLVATAAAAATLLLLATAALLWRATSREDSLDRLAALHAALATGGETGEALRSIAPAVLERRLARELPFHARVLDLAMMDLHLVAGGATTVAGGPAAWTLYRRSNAEPSDGLLCVMWRARLDQLARPSATHLAAPFEFRVYTRGERTLIAWQEGELVCVLVGRGDARELLALAQAKAMLPA